MAFTNFAAAVVRPTGFTAMLPRNNVQVLPLSTVVAKKRQGIRQHDEGRHANDKTFVGWACGVGMSSFGCLVRLCLSELQPMDEPAMNIFTFFRLFARLPPIGCAACGCDFRTPSSRSVGLP